MQLCRDEFNNQEKKLKKYKKESDIYDKVINLIKLSKDFDELKNNPISRMYGFEALKYECSGYYSFNLSKNGGVIRLIFSKGKDSTILNLNYISLDHYNDFKNIISKRK